MEKPITILYFAWLREQIGTARQELQLPTGVTTVKDLINHLSQTHTAVFSPNRKVRCAVNQEFADPSSPVRPGDEVGFFPPVTGG